MKPIKVMIVDDHELMRLGLRAALDLEDDIQVVTDAGDAQSALREAESKRPDVVLMDVRMPGVDGIKACRIIREKFTQTRVVMLTSYNEEQAVMASIMAGASGYLLKNTARSHLLSAIRSVARGESLLDPAVTSRVLERLVELTGDRQDLEVGVDAPSGQESSERPAPMKTLSNEQAVPVADPFYGLGSETTLTIMFTDIVGSSEMTERLGDVAATAVFGAHNEIIREHTVAFGGIEVKSMGDGFMLTFPSARRGVGCAVAVQRELAQHNRDDPESALAVRVGVTMGEPVREERDLFGKSVILAQRICAQARGGQVLISEIVQTLLASGREFTVRDAGAFELKGISGVHPLYEVLWDDLEGHFETVIQSKPESTEGHRWTA